MIHGAADPMFPLEHGEALAEEIPGARLLTLEGAGHGVDRADWETIVRAIVEHTAHPIELADDDRRQARPPPGPRVHTAGMDGQTSESAVTAPSVRSSELLGYPPDARVLIVNADDLEFLTSLEACELLRQEGIVVIDYRPLQQVWSQTRGDWSGGVGSNWLSCWTPSGL